MIPCSNGQSFNGQSMSLSPACPREPWVIRLLAPIQDRGGL